MELYQNDQHCFLVDNENKVDLMVQTSMCGVPLLSWYEDLPKDSIVYDLIAFCSWDIAQDVVHYMIAIIVQYYCLYSIYMINYTSVALIASLFIIHLLM